jgi:hypothetical protein
MNWTLLILFAGLTVLIVPAVITSSNVIRGTIIAVILVSGFLFPYVIDRAVLHTQLRATALPADNPACRSVWIDSVRLAHERFEIDSRVMFLANAALAIIAAIPRRVRPR